MVGELYQLLRQGILEEDQVCYWEMLNWRCLWNVQMEILCRQFKWKYHEIRGEIRVENTHLDLLYWVVIAVDVVETNWSKGIEREENS